MITRRAPLRRTPFANRGRGLARSRNALPRFSVRQRARNQQLVALKVELIAKRGPYCEAAAIYRERLTIEPWDLFVLDALQSCRGGADELHHRCKRSRGGKDAAANLMLLCLPCHRLTEHEVALATELGLLRSAEVAA